MSLYLKTKHTEQMKALKQRYTEELAKARNQQNSILSLEFEVDEDAIERKHSITPDELNEAHSGPTVLMPVASKPKKRKVDGESVSCDNVVTFTSVPTLTLLFGNCTNPSSNQD